MDFQIQFRDGPARMGQLKIKEESICTPEILYIQTSQLQAPTFSRILLTQEPIKTTQPVIQIGRSIFSTQKNNERKPACLDQYLLYPKDVIREMHSDAVKQNTNTPCYLIPGKKELIPDLRRKKDTTLCIVSDAIQLFNQQSYFVDFITTLRQQIGYTTPLYLPCVGDPTSIALLAYMGVDLFDSFPAIMAARNEIFLFQTGYYSKDHLHENPCRCPTCAIKKDVSSMNYDEILQHNYTMLDSEIQLVRNAIRTGSLRELVEIRVRTRPHLAALLHILDLNQYEFLEERTPLIRKQPLIATTKDALLRPEIRRFQYRVLHRYEKPRSAKILVLLPCSAKKPYSFSKSHQLFRECITRQVNPFVVHELILTSPLGLVPRELELTYPAKNYDIAVTGHWDEDEKKMIRTMLQEYLKHNCYDAVIVHLPAAMRLFVCDILEKPWVTCEDSPTSETSLSTLSQALEKLTSSFDRVRLQTRLYENMQSLAGYQFGSPLADHLMKESTVIGKYPYLKIMQKGTQLGMLTEERGFLSLTLEGANRLGDAEQYWVEIAGDFTLKGSVFAPGIIDADDSIRIGDEVIIRKNDTVCGVGVALMNGKEMTESSHGEAVKIRHHI
ncbi:MAG: archaeosine synthase subunit alpha [Candidatus Thermoplasmatota archaeon]|nr:archaeosine synthase subunit alpha [Candidatus Thermoplasmatota archaeon]